MLRLSSLLIYCSWKRSTRDRSPQHLMTYKSETSSVLGWFPCQFYQKLVSFSCVETNIKPPINSPAYRPLSVPTSCWKRSLVIKIKLETRQRHTWSAVLLTHSELGEHGPGNVMALQIGADSSDLKPRSKTAAKLRL